MITLKQLNTLAKEDAFNYLEQCCVSGHWITNMLENRPFKSEQELIDIATKIWYNQCKVEDFKEAFTGHPKIGNVESLKKKFANTLEWAGEEQAKISEADMETIEALAKANELYEKKFGYIFIVSASGKSAKEMLSIINARLHHVKEDEICVAMNEQHKITIIRLIKLIEGFPKGIDLKSHITTHALDTSTGIPAKHMLITLKALQDNQWKPISLGITNNDGRVLDVLPPSRYLPSGLYTMVFNTADYYEKNNQKGFYPEVSVQFEVTDKNHYHIPLLISPFGYSTYKGS